MANEHRINLNLDAEVFSGDLLNDLKIATEQVQKNQMAQKAKEAKANVRAKSKKTSMVLIGIGTLVVFIFAYWMVFARVNGDDSVVISNGTATTQSSSPIKNTCAAPTAVNSSSKRNNNVATFGRDAQTVSRPPEDLDSGNDNPGM